MTTFTRQNTYIVTYWLQTGYRLDTDWTQNGHRMVTDPSQTGHSRYKWLQSGYNVVTKWLQSGHIVGNLRRCRHCSNGYIDRPVTAEKRLQVVA